MLISTLISRFLDRFLLSERKKHSTEYYSSIVLLCYFGYSLNKICTSIHCSWSDKAPMSPKRILKDDLSYLPKILENKKLCRYLYRGA